jgi:putative transposase
MRKSRFSEEQIAYTLRQADAGAPVKELCRKLGISEQTFYVWNAALTPIVRGRSIARPRLVC